MATTLTLKNIPDGVYERLRRAAKRHRRSLNSEAIVCLESVLVPARVSVDQRLERIRQLRAGLVGEFSASNVDALKRSGRP